MIDVHAPHERISGFKDFLLHLLTITIGLLIALSMEGCVEWQHNRHLVRDAEAGLRGEITSNAQSIGSLRQQVKSGNKQLNDDLAALAVLRAHPDERHEHMSLGFGMRSFDQVAWKTAQTTGAFGYMPYGDASEFEDIYDAQDEVLKVQQQVVDDVIQAISLVAYTGPDWKPTSGQIDEATHRIVLIEVRLNLLSSAINSLDEAYRKYQTGHK